MADANSQLLAASFDFGTTFSGYAFSFRDDPRRVYTNNTWNAGSLLSLKTPTCILLDPQEKFHSFGYEAENEYKALVEEDNHHDWMFFRRFKMLLYNNKKLCRRTTVKDITGKRRMFAVDIFSMSIRYLRDHFLRQLQKQFHGFEESDVEYVLTIPAIWDENGKQFMRMAALQADIDNDRLKLALEPEAASIWCQTLTADSNKDLSKPGSQYIVIDIGGGTVDITAHERNDDGTLRELYKASGGPWGGIYVDRNFLNFFIELFGEKVMSRFEQKDFEDYLDMLRGFETSKRSVTSAVSSNQEYISFKLSAALREFSEEENSQNLDELVRSSPLSSAIVNKRDKIRLSLDLVKKWFDGPVDQIICHVKDILSKPEVQQVSSVLLVGGMAESSYVQEKIRTAFSQKHLIIPNDASLAVLKGAVIYGHEPTSISARVMRYSYGVEMFKRFNSRRHSSLFQVTIGGNSYCDNVFHVFVKAGDTVNVGQKVSKKSSATNKEMSVYPIYRSPSSKPKFTTDPGTAYIGCLSLRHNSPDEFKSKGVEVTMIFGDTELIVKAKEIDTGNESFSTFNCLLD